MNHAQIYLCSGGHFLSISFFFCNNFTLHSLSTNSKEQTMYLLKMAWHGVHLQTVFVRSIGCPNKTWGLVAYSAGSLIHCSWNIFIGGWAHSAFSDLSQFVVHTRVILVSLSLSLSLSLSDSFCGTCHSGLIFAISLSFSLTHTHAHTHCHVVPLSFFR